MDQGEPTGLRWPATRKRARRAEAFYRNVERGLRLQTEKIRQKIAEKMDQGKFYATEESA